MKPLFNHIILLSGIFIFIGCKNDEATVKATSSQNCLEEKTKSIIELNTVSIQNVSESIHMTGSIEANPDKVVNFVSLVPGIITNTYFTLGDAVTKGQVLAEMQSTELSSLNAALSTINSQIEIAKVDLEAKEQMFNDGISSNKELIEAKNNLLILESEKKKIRSNMSMYSSSSSKNVFQIKAPATGIITEKNINPGSTITDDGISLFSISNLNNVWAMANVYATDIAHINKGMEVEIKTISYPNETFIGNIDVISQVLDQDAKVLKARVVLENSNFKLKPGMIADIMVHKKSEKKAVAIPTSSIVFFNNKNYVLVYHDDCNIEAREIAILTKKNETTFIQSGLSENEKIITKNQLLIFEKYWN